jgi:hypothetical protein
VRHGFQPHSRRAKKRASGAIRSHVRPSFSISSHAATRAAAGWRGGSDPSCSAAHPPAAALTRFLLPPIHGGPPHHPWVPLPHACSHRRHTGFPPPSSTAAARTHLPQPFVDMDDEPRAPPHGPPYQRHRLPTQQQKRRYQRQLPQILPTS